MSPALGTGSNDVTGQTVTVGGPATGSLSLSGGASLTADALIITPGQGAIPGAAGTVTVDGSGTLVTLGGLFNRLDVGNWGQGSLTISGGAVVDAASNSGACLNTCFSFIGNAAGSNATVNITGAGSRLDTINFFGVGGIAVFQPPDFAFSFGTPGGATTAAVNITAGGALNATDMTIGNTFGRLMPSRTGTETSNATALVDGIGSTLNVTNGNVFTGLQVGVGGGATGALTVSNGGTASVNATAGTAFLNVGTGADPGNNGGQGTVTVAGSGSNLSVTGFTGASTNIGQTLGANGSLTVSNGATATLGGVNVGLDQATGTLNVLSGGSVNLLNLFASGGGNGGGGNGTITVDGLGSALNFSGGGASVALGNSNGTGVLTIRNGATVTGVVNTSLGNFNGAVGTLTVNSGGSYATGSATFGTADGSSGTLSVSGAGSQFSASQFVSVGGNGSVNQGTGSVTVLGGAAMSANGMSVNNGTLALGSGGDLTTTGLSVGANFGPVAAVSPIIGTATVDGAGSQLTITAATPFAGLNVGGGSGGNGSLSITDGGALSINATTGFGFLNVGGGTPTTGGQGTLLVDGLGSSLSMTGTTGSSLTLGAGTGSSATVTVSGGATASLVGTGASATIGSSAGSTSTATITGTGSALTIANGLTIGNNGTGTLNVNAGASVVQQGQNGGVTIVGNGATGQGTLNINAGSMTLLTAELGNPPGERHAFLGVGRDGTGTVNVTNGGQLTIGTAASGTQAGANFGAGINIGGNQAGAAPTFPTGVQGTGTVTVSGAGSTLDLLGVGAFINVGRFGATSQGTLDINSGGQVNVAGSVNVGRGATDSSNVTVPGFGATGTVTVDGAGSQLNLVGRGSTGGGVAAFIGQHDGTGTMTVRNGATLNVASVGATTTAGGLFVGAGIAGSNGTLNIQSGATVNVSSNLDGPAVAIGGTSNGILSMNGGTLNVTGTDALLFVGRNAGSTGTATILGGATVNADVLLVGSAAGSVGSATISGAGTTVNLTGDPAGSPTTGGGLAVGRSGVGSATIAGGATVNVDVSAGGGGGVRVGGSDTAGGGTGSLIVTGPGTTVNGTGGATLHLGRNAGSTGTMTISSGAAVTLDPTGSAVVGYTGGSTGVLTVTGAGSTLNAGSFLGIGQQAPATAGGTGIMNVTLGGQVIADTVHNGATGTITGSGTVTATTFINDGVINPGNSPGTLRIQVADFQNNGTIVLEILENPDGSYSLDTLVFDDGFVPDLNDVQFVFLGDTNAAEAAAAGQLDIDNFLKAEDSETGQVLSLFAALQNDVPPGDANPLLDQFNQVLATTTFAAVSETNNQPVDLTGFNLTPDGAAVNDVTDVPEPASLGLLASGLAGLFWLRRRRAA